MKRLYQFTFGLVAGAIPLAIFSMFGKIVFTSWGEMYFTALFSATFAVLGVIFGGNLYDLTKER